MELMLMDSLEAAKLKAASMKEPLCVQVGEERFRILPNGETFAIEQTALSTARNGGPPSLLDKAAGRVVCNFDGDDRQRWLLDSLATGAKALSKSDLAGKTFKVKYYFLQETTVMDGEGGEMKDCIRTVLISPDNEVAAFVSEGVAKSVALMARRFPDKALEPPLEVVVVETKTGNNRSYLSLAPAGVSNK